MTSTRLHTLGRCSKTWYCTFNCFNRWQQIHI